MQYANFFSLKVVCSASPNSKLKSADYNAINSSDVLTFPTKGQLRVVYTCI